ncbi:hypothetical protein BC829DRAFT_407046 [Chytridium lagenaria]|nr:hypothetical protein BC829DRAFT_407046 [Chytridium lagenaria]
MQDMETLKTLTSKVDQLSKLPPPKSDCACYIAIDADEPAKCVSCSGRFDSIRDLQMQRIEALKILAEVRRKMQKAKYMEDAAAAQTSVFTARIEELGDLMDSKAEEYIRIEKDLQVMKEKVADEIEKRTELQISKDDLQDELDELSKSLLEEANVLKSHEEKKREMFEDKEKILMKELTEARTQLQMEQLRLRELKLKMEETRQNEDSLDRSLGQSDSASSLNSIASLSGSRPSDPVDPTLLTEFKDFLSYAPTIKLNKIATLQFMKNALEDDITPCLRFGGNPRTSTKRLLDAIILNSCFIEEMTSTQMVAHNSLLIQSQSVKLTPPTDAPITPTQAIFQKTVLERISTWTSSSSSAAQSAIVPGGCSTCGKIGVVRFQFKISEQPEDPWCPICGQCRDRLIAVCEFYNLIRHIRQGLYSTRRHEDLYLEMLALKRKIFFARMGAASHVKLEKPFAKSRTLLRPDSQLMRDFEAVTSPQ